MSELVVRTRTGQATRAVAAALASVLRAGDLLVLTGPLGAGKTTFTQGLGGALGVRGPVASPTFVLSRVHPSLTGGPALVHVDAYRLSGALDIDELDLETDLDRAVTVVEWGGGLVEQLSDSRLDIVLDRPDTAEADGPDEPRTLRLAATGPAWTPDRIAALRDAVTRATGASS